MKVDERKRGTREDEDKDHEEDESSDEETEICVLFLHIGD